MATVQQSWRFSSKNVIFSLTFSFHACQTRKPAQVLLSLWLPCNAAVLETVTYAGSYRHCTFACNSCFPILRQTDYKSHVTAFSYMPFSSAEVGQWWKSDYTWEAQIVASLLQNCNERSSCRATYRIWNSSHSPAVGQWLQQTRTCHMQEAHKWRKVTFSFLVLEHFSAEEANGRIWGFQLKWLGCGDVLLQNARSNIHQGMK